MHSSQFLNKFESCSSSIVNTPLKKKKNILLSPPSREPKKLNKNNFFQENLEEKFNIKSENDKLEGKRFWDTFKKINSIEKSDNSNSIMTNDSSSSDEVNDDFFEFEIDEDPVWSEIDVEEKILKNKEISDKNLKCKNENKTSRNIQMNSLKKFNKDNNNKEIKNINLSEKLSNEIKDQNLKNDDKDNLNKKIYKENDSNKLKLGFNKNIANSMKNIKEQKLSYRFKSLDTSLVFDLYNNINFMIS